MRIPLAVACVVGLACHPAGEADPVPADFAAAQGQVRVVALLSPT